MRPLISATIIMSAAQILFCSCNSKDNTGEENAMTVDVARAVEDSVMLTNTYPGILRCVDLVDVMARVSGTLLSQNFENGQEVKKGQLLFTIEDTKYRDAVQEAQANLASARSTHKYAESHYAAMQKALESDAVSQMEVKQALSALQQSESAIKSAQAALQTAQTNLSYCRIYAPFDGRTTAGIYSDGQYINGEASPEKLCTIYKDSELDARFSIEDASFIRSFTNQNNRHLINYDSIPINFSEPLPHNYYGNLRYISPEVSTATGTLELRARLKNSYGELREGMYVNVSLPYAIDPKAVLVKDASISTDQLGKYIYTVNDSNKVVYTPITVGEMVNDSMRVVKSGVKSGTPYVTKALLKVRNGMSINPHYTK